MKTCSVALSLAALLSLSMARPHAVLQAQTFAGPANPAAIPADRLNESWWAQRHASILQNAARHADSELLLIGDSTFNNFDVANPPDQDFQLVWKQFYAPRRALNLGFTGDTTSNVLWRIDHGELDGLDPRVVVVLVGGANTAVEDQTARQTVDGIDAVVGDIARRLPLARIVLLGILPAGVSAEKNARDQEVNSRLETLFAGDRRVLYLDIGAIFYDRGALNQDMFCATRTQGEVLHPNLLGQLRLAEAIEPAISNLLRDTPRTGTPLPNELVQTSAQH